MAKAAKSSAKGQKSITSFFKAPNSKPPKAKAPRKEPDEDDEDIAGDGDASADDDDDEYQEKGEDKDEEDEDEEGEADAETEASEAEESDEAPAPKKKSGKAKAVAKTTKPTGAPDESDLPPINDISAMFADMVSHIPKIKGVVEHVNGRKLRVATMCSGTESPLLALDLICKSIREQHGLNLAVEHVFSCEIEPFKQAYIERNFHPPLLFRDVCELGANEATTAYGAKAPVPGDVDILIAGTSCVDYSNLNNKKQEIDGNGESGQTFRGMLKWVKKHQPPLVILENVCSAPWKRVEGYFKDIGYSAAFHRVDTKFYYIPHTRTRVYLIAVNKKKSDIPNEWKDIVVNQLKRPASSALDAFLLPSDDPRIHQSREKLVQESYNALDRRTGRTDWGKCESRHQRGRLEEELGTKRPLTGWDEGGNCKLPDFAWNDWGKAQVERVWDLMDISLLRSAKNGVDPSYKTQVWNLSQNVDRTIGSNKAGICPCLTPSMIPYITNRGGPLVGIEALSMQGLPVDALLLTRETEDQLADLAGNAMSTTVVGACILAALVAGKSLIKGGDDTESYEKKNASGASDGRTHDDDAMDVDDGAATVVALEDRIAGEDQLNEKELDLSVSTTHSLPALLAHAERSARLCECEGRKNVTERVVRRCADCGATSCTKCGGRPEHNFAPLTVKRTPPSAYAQELKAALPMRLSVATVTRELLDGLKEAAGVDIPKKRWASWADAVIRAASLELRFVEPKRQEIWSAVYQSPTASLELLLHPQQPEWRLYAKPEASLPANAELRKVLQMPIARLTCAGGLLDGRWEFALPSISTVPITIAGVENGAQTLVPSWEKDLGLTGEEFKDRMVYSQLQISVPDGHDAKDLFDRDISGVYTLLNKCGTANSALHRRTPGPGEEALPPLFMLLDPSRCGAGENDSFVFSISKRRYEFGETRPIVCKLDSRWRQSSVKDAQEIDCEIPYKWVQTDAVALKPLEGQKAQFAVPGEVLTVESSLDACGSANAILSCKVDLHGQAGPEWPREEWGEIDKVHERETYRNLGFLTERIRNIDANFKDWQSVELPPDQVNCQRCAPTPPEMKFAYHKGKIVPIEDPVQAGEFERALKRRPTPFVTQLKLDAEGLGHVRIGINIPSLLHRALSRLPSTGRTEQALLSWRLNTDFSPMAKLNLGKFRLTSNKLDPEHKQPPDFKIPLRKEQLRSLSWMLKQEARDIAPFIEEEIAEATLEPLAWRAEGRAQRPVHVRGGVLADQVGYGKTAITLGLIDCAAKEVKKELAETEDVKGKIPLKATLVVVPSHLTKQWAAEIVKFTGKRFKHLVITSQTQLNNQTIENFQEVDIVIVASSLFKSAAYMANLDSLAATGSLPQTDGRFFNARLNEVMSSLGDQVDRLRDEGASAVKKAVREARERGDESIAKVDVPSKRKKGKSYRDAVVVEDDKPTQEAAASKSKQRSPSGLVMEVVIPVPPKRSASSSSADEGPVDVDEASDSPKPRKRRASAKKALVVISDDEDDAADASSDYEGPLPSSENDADSDDTAFQTSPASEEESEDEKPKKKGKAAAKPKAAKPKKASKSQASGSSDVESMDVDAPSKRTSKKRKADDDDSEPSKKKPKHREDTDPWQLGLAKVRADWTQMRAPPLHMFHFARKVVDEYTYLEGIIYAMVSKLSAERHWVLSGTPPVHDFAALKTISAFLDIHLGVDDDGEGQSVEVKKRRRDMTAVEKFHSFREVHSLEWHAHRHAHGQMFLDRFVRQNVAEIDEIHWKIELEDIVQPASERAVYLELEHHLRAMDMTIKRSKKNESDRERRLAKSLGDSSTAEEALLKRCSHFDLDTSKTDNSMKACEVIVRERTKQRDECEAEILAHLKKGLKLEKDVGKTGEESAWREWIRWVFDGKAGDADATALLKVLFDKAGIVEAGAKQAGKPKELDKKTAEKVWALREHTHIMRRLEKELVGRVRSLRYFTAVRNLQKGSGASVVVTCPMCEDAEIPHDEVAVLSTCGHMGCTKHVRECAAKEECLYKTAELAKQTTDGETGRKSKESDICSAAARVTYIVEAKNLGVDDVERTGKGKHYGAKLEAIVKLIKKRLPADERVLIFVQFPDLMKKVEEVLIANKITYLELKGSANSRSSNLTKFQENGPERVLLLNVMEESASGANLTAANHAIFVSPLLAASQEKYNATETQAVGRLVRYGQLKTVKVWRFLTRDTIDYDIYESRTVHWDEMGKKAARDAESAAAKAAGDSDDDVVML
ncbi:hypothetical protein PLICRDRAFT_125381 [Plicaturopsis crispa FD-325 SS-3]|nr:hypothetical protein PLICRDRAFT_125381 [Plicaturopsis crispa FD-325 SS-3]